MPAITEPGSVTPWVFPTGPHAHPDPTDRAERRAIDPEKRRASRAAWGRP
ncbi:hypothetical protein [Pseudonocardia lacus]|nr:hypothetical protein [Pseudonocardia lacus]